MRVPLPLIGTRLRPVRTAKDVRILVWPIAKRLPAYIRLGWALGREPAIPNKHKAFLISAALYTVTPANMVTAAVPVLGQIDSIALFLLGLRHAIRYCPPEIAARHMARVKLGPDQLNDDLRMVMHVAASVMGNMSASAGRNLKFLGRVAAKFTSRVARRAIIGEPESRIVRRSRA